jgi:asparagine synthase (glutamine-hydrolysing)
MCGINGIAGVKDHARSRQLIERMNGMLAHRGPDDGGIFVEPEIALGHCRLSIIDLSAAGHQPMVSTSKRYCISFNGEIYNFAKLKKELGEYSFSNQTDTEVILAAYEKWGKSCLAKLEGMFAFAIWDKDEKELFVARDRLGIKPLYFHHEGDALLFSSEMRPLLKSGIVPRQINNEALVDYLRYQTVHAPATIIKNVNMLLPGHFMTFKDGQLQIKEYWNVAKDKADWSQVGTENYEEITDRVSLLLHSAVEKRLMADVPFGAFLSGGIDSSIIVGLMSQMCNQKVNTFSVSFAEEEFDESKYARQVANKFDTNHTEIHLEPGDFLEHLPQALSAMDHPSGDGPNTYVVSKVTRESGIVVALSGLGGDEIFAGYDRFRYIKKLYRNRWMAHVPGFLKHGAGELIKRIRPGGASEKLTQVLSLKSWDINSIYPITRQVLHDEDLSSLLNGTLTPNSVQKILEGYKLNKNGKNEMPLLSKVSVAEISTYMQNVLLRDTDQMSMASSLEVRVPFLDHQLLEYVLAVPDKFKYPSTPKKLLIDATKGLLPTEVINRPKMGFTLPWEKWLKNDLNSFCTRQLHALGKRKEFDDSVIKQLWQSFLQGDGRVAWSRIWILVVLQHWLDENDIEH